MLSGYGFIRAGNGQNVLAFRPCGQPLMSIKYVQHDSAITILVSNLSG